MRWLLLLLVGTAFANQVPFLQKVQYPLAVDYGVLPAGVSTTRDYYALYVCSTPSGLITEEYMGVRSLDAMNILNYLSGGYTSAQAISDCAAQCGSTFTVTESAFLAARLAADRPVALVAFNGASTTRNVYALNADGTLNPTAVAGESIAVAAPCDETTRIPTAPTYYSVAGQKDQNGNALPQGDYAVCVVSFPIGYN